jgi:acyl CoA:acetate/3-ketoacid CoA transferase
MEFRPKISAGLRLMDPRIFADAPMSLRKDLLTPPGK